ncbi:MAG: hypothetical protein SOW31_11440 [Treponema sp.]|nr:hypothetical protein [Treponema sp.]
MILLKNKNKKANIKIGNNIEIKDGSDFPFDLTLYGKSTQATRSGKNLLNPNGASQNGSGLTFTNNGDGSFTVEGTSTANLSLVLSTQKIKLNANQPYTQSITTVSGTKTGEVVVSVKNSSDKITFNYIAGNQTITPTEDLTTHTYTYYVASGKTVNWTFKVQLEEGTTATEYEPYGVMPSPDYPSPIESVGRKNIIKSLSSKWSSGINYNLDNSLIKKTMTFSCIIDTSITSANLYIIPATGVSAISLGTINFTANQRATKTFNLTDEQIQAIKSNQGGIFQIYKSSAFESANITDVQLEKGTVVTDYVPYEHTEISATVTGKNLFDENELTLNKTQVDNKTCYEIAGTTATTSNVLLDKQLEENTQYTLSMVAKKVQYFNMLYFYYTDGTETHKTFTNTNFQKISITSTANKTINKILIDTGDRSAKNYIEVGTIQLEKGTQTTEYEEYKSNSLTIDLQGNELCSLPNGTKDEVNITNGKSSIVKRTKEFILDENKAIVLDKVLTNTTRFLIYNVTYSMNDYPSAISTHFKYLVDYNSDTEHFYITRNGAIYLFVNKSIASTVDELKTWLSKNNVKFLYELAEPETINLGTVEMPHTYEGVSNITNSADTEMVVKYYKKFEFDKILRSGYNIDEQEYEIAKKQMANGKRKKILSSYVDCIIKIDLGLLDNKTYQEYKGQLEDGEYEYWSYKYNQYKKANFILTKPSITTEYAYDDEIGIDDMEITLEKSSDVS